MFVGTRTNPNNPDSRIAANRRYVIDKLNAPLFTPEQHLKFNIENDIQLNKELSESGFEPVENGNYVCSIFLVGAKSNYGNWKGVVDIELIRKWANSLKETGLLGVMFHNCFDKAAIDSFAKYPVTFIKVSIRDNQMSGLFRYEIYNAFLDRWGDEINGAFFSDSTDVLVLKNPFIHKDFDNEKVFVGNEIGNKNHSQATASTHWILRETRGYEKYNKLAKEDAMFCSRPLLNAGLCGGTIKAIRPFIKRMAQEANSVYPVAAIQDMAIINYLSYTEFKDVVVYNDTVNTIFGAWDTENKKAWFAHK